MSRETDTKPGGKLYEAAKQEGADLSKKICETDGPLHLTRTEARTLRLLMYGLQQQAGIAQQVNSAMAEALQRQGFQLTHHEGPDGSVTFDLQNKPQPAAETVN